MIWDSIIIGAGAAGLMTALTARRAGVSSVLLLDTKDKIGAKILMSGGTRCNLTNETVTEKDFQTQEPNILKSILKFFPSGKALEFFRGLGVETVLEEGGKHFPVTHSGHTVLDALLKEAHRLGITLESPRKVTGIRWEQNAFTVSGEKFSYQGKTAVLTTGGLSYPTSGSDGSGYEFAKNFGHKIIPTTPALTPLKNADQDFQALSGLALPVCLTLWVNGKKKESCAGDFLFTHTGYSGPVVLDMSRHWIRSKAAAELTASFFPGVSEDVLTQKLMSQIEFKPNRYVRSFMIEFFPERLAEALLKKAGILEDTVFNQLKKESRKELLKFLFHCPLGITEAVGYQKAEVTAGGVDLAEVQRKTLESKLQPGLFFAGEILDVDGRIGGFNFQWAWASGTAAGFGIKERLG